MAGAAVGWAVGELFAASVAAEVVGGFVATSLLGAGVAAGTSLLVSSVVVAGAGLLAGQIVGGLVNEAITGSPESGGVSASSSSSFSAAASSVSAARAQGVLINTSSNVESIPVIYGTRKVGGSRALLEVSGASNEYLHFVICLCEGEIDAVSQIYLNDLPITDPRYAGLTYSETYLGTNTQAANASLIATLPGKWTAQHTGSGLAYVYIRLLYSQNVFSGIPTFTFDVRGKKVYDPRTNVTAYSNNPALCVRDYLTNTRYGRGIPTDKIDDVAIVAAANHCEELVAIPGGTQARYTCDGVIDINNTCFENLKTLVSTCRGMPIYSAGIYRLVIDKAETPGFAFTEDNITGDWTIAQPGRRAKFNRVTASIFNPSANWQPDFGISESPAYRALDNGLLLEAKLGLPFTANLYRAQQLAGLFMKQSRFGIVARFNALQVGLRAEVGDVVTITHTTPGWTAKPFRIMQMELTSDDQVEVVCSEYDASVYNLDTLTAITGAATSNLPDVFVVNPPGTPTVSESLYETTGSAGVRSLVLVQWSAGDAFVSGYFPEFKLASSSVWIQLPMVRLPLTSVMDLAPGVYNFRVRAENIIGARSEFSGIATREVLGLTALPANVLNLSVISLSGTAIATWDLHPDLDVRIGGRIIARHTPMVAGAIWENGIILDEFNGDAISATLPLLTGTYMLKARDSTGNYSAAMVAFVATESLITGFTTVATVTESPAFTGVKTNVFADAGVLKLDGATPIDGMTATVDSWGFIDSLGGIAGMGTYVFNGSMDFGAVLARKINVNVQAIAIDSGDMLDDRGLIDDWGAADGGVINDCDATVYFRSTQTNPAGAPTWSVWTPFMTADVVCWGLQFKIELTSGSLTHNILISSLSVAARSSP